MPPSRGPCSEEGSGACSTRGSSRGPVQRWLRAWQHPRRCRCQEARSMGRRSEGALKTLLGAVSGRVEAAAVWRGSPTPRPSWQGAIRCDGAVLLARRYDAGRDGFIDLMELKLMMEKLGAPQTHIGLKNMIKEVDEDLDSKLSFREVRSRAGWPGGEPGLSRCSPCTLG